MTMLTRERSAESRLPVRTVIQSQARARALQSVTVYTEYPSRRALYTCDDTGAQWLVCN
jgi:hypothetical protein